MKLNLHFHFLFRSVLLVGRQRVCVPLDGERFEERRRLPHQRTHQMVEEGCRSSRYQKVCIHYFSILSKNGCVLAPMHILD